MRTIREHLYLAALLHDIGKFYQRADTGSVSSSQFLKEMIRRLEGSILPLGPHGNYTHKHALWTAQFIEDYSSVFRQLSTGSLEDLTQRDNLIMLASCHHLAADQQTALGRLLKKADHLSSGMDRDNAEALQDDQDEAAWDSFKKKRMVALLQYIKGNPPAEAPVYHQPLGKVSLSKDYFPKASFGQEAPDYSGLWAEFTKEFRLIQSDTYRAFAETLLNLLFKYATAIPSSTVHFPDVSLYDHLKTTAAIAVCLYDYQHDTPCSGTAPFLLIGADLSGIQRYIYQIVSKAANKNLKGRSFYLKILSDSIVRYLCKELGLYQAHVIYNSGGGFYLLAPNTREVREKLETAIGQIEAALFQAHGTSLYAAIDAVEVTEDALMHRGGASLQDVWRRLFDKREKKKNARFHSLIEADCSRFFSPFMYAEGCRDSVTGELFGPGEKVVREKTDEGELMRMRKLTCQQRELGKYLRQSDLLVVAEGEIPYWRDKTFIEPGQLGFFYYLLNYQDIDRNKEQLRSSADKVTVITLNGKRLDGNFMRPIDGINNIYALEFYGGNIYSGKTFEEMCTNEGFSRLGVLRMDVDNLGSIFQQGIPAQRATLSRYAALSRSLDYFFSGYLNRIHQEVAPERSAIVYSGGDDLFIVGSWEVTLALAERIRADFGEYTCYNPHFSVSGGVALVADKFPLIKAAAMSEEEEKEAKSHSFVKQGTAYEKNSFSLFRTPLNWQAEWPCVKELKETLVTYIEQGMMPKSFLSKVLRHAMNARIRRHEITHMASYWMMTYDLSRMKGREARSKEASALIQNCINEVCGRQPMLNGSPVLTAYHPLELWAFAARWAELQLRTNNNL